MKSRMRHIVFFFVIFGFLISEPSLAQEYRKMRLGAGAGLSLTSGKNGKGGPVFYVEPAFRVTDKLLMGISLEGASITRGLSRPIAITNPVTVYNSGFLFTQYYFGKKYFRTFIGGGAGFVRKSNGVLVVNYKGTVSTFQIGGTNIGFNIRAGAEWGHFNASIDYNFMEDEIASPFLEIKNNYPSIRVGVFIGGGIH